MSPVVMPLPTFVVTASAVIPDSKLAVGILNVTSSATQPTAMAKAVVAVAA